MFFIQTEEQQFFISQCRLELYQSIVEKNPTVFNRELVRGIEQQSQVLFYDFFCAVLMTIAFTQYDSQQQNRLQQQAFLLGRPLISMIDAASVSIIDPGSTCFTLWHIYCTI